MTREEYLDFMYDRSNIRKCDRCPENHGFDSWQDRLPCGQYTCWVYCHCKDEIEAERLEKARKQRWAFDPDKGLVLVEG